MRKHILILMTAILVLVLATVAMAADDPFLGMWKWVSSTPPEPVPVGSWWTTRFEIQDNGYHIMQDGVVSADGKTLHLESTDMLDGKEYPLTGNPAADATVARRIDTYNYEAVNLKDGVEVVRMRFSVSKDGKTLTIFRQNKNPQGKDVTLTRLMAKQ
jgi:opacity protein-like surface antigen